LRRSTTTDTSNSHPIPQPDSDIGTVGGHAIDPEREYPRNGRSAQPPADVRLISSLNPNRVGRKIAIASSSSSMRGPPGSAGSSADSSAGGDVPYRHGQPTDHLTLVIGMIGDMLRDRLDPTASRASPTQAVAFAAALVHTLGAARPRQGA
jgi:hypothetical protein